MGALHQGSIEISSHVGSRLTSELSGRRVYARPNLTRNDLQRQHQTQFAAAAGDRVQRLVRPDSIRVFAHQLQQRRKFFRSYFTITGNLAH